MEGNLESETEYQEEESENELQNDERNQIGLSDKESSETDDDAPVPKLPTKQRREHQDGRTQAYKSTKYCNNWGKMDIGHGSPPPAYTGPDVGATFDLVGADEIISSICYFENFFNNDLVNIIVIETNCYAAQKSVLIWEDFREMKAYLRMLVAMAIHKLPNIGNYFSGDWVLGVPAFQKIFTRDRFRWPVVFNLWYAYH